MTTIYTSYFSRIKSLPPNAVPISIARVSPNWYFGASYGKLSPDYRLLQDWKRDHNEEHYKLWFGKHLQQLDPHAIVDDLKKFIPSKGQFIVLMCYENNLNFCHRHLVSEWLRSHGYESQEFMPNRKKVL